MRLVNVDHDNAAVNPAARGVEQLLEIDPAAFRDNFARRPFLIGHRLADHPLFQLPRLLELARSLPEANVEYNAGDIPISVAPELTPRTGLSPEETVRRIEECRSWMALKYVEHDPDYRDLLERCLAEVRPHSAPIAPGMMQAQAFIFLTSPHSVTPYHMDPEHNFLLQIRGSKRIHQFDPCDRSIVTEQDLERFYGGAHRNMTFREEFRSKAWVFDLQPGQGLHFPVTAPHFVENGPSVSVSFSITFRTPDLERRSIVHNVNAYLRGRGWRPSPFGQRPWRDRLKAAGYRMWRKARAWLGRPVS
ncbi:MAG: cupin-like domain-containing protein [Gemmataceae bacterium]|nr:cupin-like domain-containing protein [Gemmataceae bacterium]